MANSQSDSVAQALAGAGGGALAMIVTYPLIALSTRAQTNRSKSAAMAEKAAHQEENKEKSIKHLLTKKPTVMSAAAKIIQREGFGALYSGLDSALFGITVTNFVYYYFYEGTRGVFEKRKRLSASSIAATATATMSTLESMIAGAIAGSATVVLTNPIWVVNTRQTVRASPQGGASILGTIKDILTSDGLKGFFAGIFPALVLVINPILQYTIFERLKAVIEKRRQLKPFDFFILGALCKLVATSVTYPYITVKSRMQVQRRSAANTDSSSDEKPVVYKSTISALREISSSEGIASLYSGMDSKLVQSVLTSAFLFYFKEQLVDAAKKTLQIVRKSK
ncbi:mitochondrial carrier domain-containing protein [Lipomyces arxii]|uniref:mitochondrial carrier domain-containing protein n=1 Tax=Lipomyces arxii TaxID=56418 RepID=UPI0034CEFE0F